MRVGVCNRYWATAGGGETYALAIAGALAEQHDVELLTPPGVDFDDLGARLHADTSRFDTRVVDFDSRSELLGALADYDLAVNTTYATDLPSTAPRGLLVVHFPVRVDRDLRAHQRAAFRLFARSAASRRNAIDWGVGFHGHEGGSPGFRWTDGDAELGLWVDPGRTVDVEVVFGTGRPSPTTVEIEYEGTTVASTEVGAGGAPAARVRFKVTGRPDGLPVRLRVRSDTFLPAEVLGTVDIRRLGVQVARVRVGGSPASLLTGRASFLERAYELRWIDTYDRVLVNSEFTRGWVRRWWGRDASVLHPAVTPRRVGSKGPLILSVGRFFAPERGHCKKQLEMVVAFRRLVQEGLTGWELHLVGGCQEEDLGYLRRVEAMAQGLPVHVHLEAPGEALSDLYARASIYWHAAGLFEDPVTNPERQEHFGIAVVEAMSAGTVPVVFGVAGPTETVRHDVDGFHFHSVEELVGYTRQLVGDEGRRRGMSAAAVEGAKLFSPDALASRLDHVLRGLPGASPTAA